MASYANSATTVFVGNLPWATSQEELTLYMQGAGNVVSTEVMTHADSGRSKGWALVHFSTPDEAQFAINHFHDKEFQDRNLNVRLDRSNVEQLGGVTIFVGNLPWSCKDEQLAQLFAAFNPLDVHVKTFQSGKSRGFGIVRLPDDGSAQEAISKLNGLLVDDRNIEVREDRPRPVDAAPPAPRRPNTRRTRNPSVDKAPADPSTTLYVSNLSWQSTNDDLFQHFVSAAGVTPDSATVQYLGKTSRSKGWGLVVCNSVEDAQRAKDSLDKSELDGRTIAVRFDAKA